jgi:hypothetical protein
MCRYTKPENDYEEVDVLLNKIKLTEIPGL